MTLDHLSKYVCLRRGMKLAVRAAVCALKRCQVARNTVILGTHQEKIITLNYIQNRLECNR